MAKAKKPAKKKADKDEKLPKIVVLRNKVYESNELVEARRNFNAIGMRLFFLGLQTLNPHFSDKDKYYDEEFPRVLIPTAQVVEAFGGHTQYLQYLKRECDRMGRTLVEFDYERGHFKINPVFVELEYKSREGLYVEFNPKLREYLLELWTTKGYTAIDVEQIFKLSSTYAMRLVELMLQYQNLAKSKGQTVIERRITLVDLRFMLNVKKTAYVDRIDHFRDRVLDTPISEINAKTLYEMRYEVERDGKPGGRVAGFVFFMDVSAARVDSPPVGEESAVEKLRELGFSESAAEAILAKCDGEADCLKRITVATLSLRSKKLRGGVENELGYLRACIEEDWAPRSKSTVKGTNQPLPIAEVLPETPKTASVARCTPRRGASKPSKVLPPLTEAEKPPRGKISALREPAADEFMEGETPVVPSFRKLIASAIVQGNLTEGLQVFLEPFGLTVERFRELYM